MSFFDFIPVEVIQGAITLASSFFMYGVHQVAKHFKEKTSNERTKLALDMVGNLVTGAVKQTEQTLAQGLKAANADGKLTNSEMKQLRHNVVNKVHENLTTQTKKEVLKVVPDLQTYVETKIEEAICDIKTSKIVTSMNIPSYVIDAVGNVAETGIENIIDEAVNAIKRPVPRQSLENTFGLDE